MVQGWQNIPSFVEVMTWVARVSGEATIVAVADLVVVHSNENQHLAQANLGVLPSYRCRGIGRRLLALIADAAVHEKRGTHVAETSDRVPAGEAFARNIGAHKSLEMHTNQLILAELSKDVLQRWLDLPRTLDEHYELLFWPVKLQFPSHLIFGLPRDREIAVWVVSPR